MMKAKDLIKILKRSPEPIVCFRRYNSSQEYLYPITKVECIEKGTQIECASNKIWSKGKGAKVKIIELKVDWW